MSEMKKALDKATEPKPPEGFTPGVTFDEVDGYIIPDKPDASLTDLERVMRLSGLNPDDYIIDRKGVQGLTSHIKDDKLAQKWVKIRFRLKPEKLVGLDEISEILSDTVEPVEAETSEEDLVVFLTDTHIGKSELAGAGTDILIERWRQYVTNALGRGRWNSITIALGGDLIEGYISQGGANINETDMDLREQVRTAAMATIWTINRALEHTDAVCVATIPGNHSETTRSQNVAMTDSYDLLIADVAEIHFTATEHASKISWLKPDEGKGSVVIPVGGTDICLVHGHKFSGSKPLDGAKDWWGGHIVSGRPEADADVLLFGHYHTFLVENWNGRTIICGPGLETESTWLSNMKGLKGDPGVVSFVVRNGRPDRISTNNF